MSTPTAKHTTETVPIEQVETLERNPRRHPSRQIEELQRSLRAFGQYRDLIVDEDGTVLGGNGLLTAMRAEGYTEVNVRRLTGLSEADKRKLILTDNRTGDLSNDDFALVDELLKEIGDFDIPGYDPDVLRDLLGDSEHVLQQAESYGSFSPEEIERVQNGSERIEEADAGARQGSAPEPYQPPAPEPVEAEDGTRTCPTCGQPWG